MLLAKVDPLKIVIDPRFLKPNEWDRKVIAEDLNEYVRVTRLIKGTPVLRLVEGALVTVNGEPFVRAARELVPPLKDLLCLIEGTEESARALGLEVVTASVMLDAYPTYEFLNAVEMLVFTRALTNDERDAVEGLIAKFCTEMNADSSDIGESMSAFKWDYEQRKVNWTWRRNDEFGGHALTFLNLLRHVNCDVVPISSWNGFKPLLENPCN